MVRVLMHGCCGAMGRVITGLAADREDLKIVAGVDRNTDDSLGYPVFQSLEACDVEVDAIIDFTAAPAVDHLLDYCAEKKVPVVLCSTGLSDAQMAKVSESAKKVAVLRSANMSLGINLLMKLVKDAAATLADAGFDIEIVEKHHNRKLDAPSGTALALADSINEAMEDRYHYTYDRSARHEKRDPKEIGISARMERSREKVTMEAVTAVIQRKMTMSWMFRWQFWSMAILPALPRYLPVQSWIMMRELWLEPLRLAKVLSRI